MSSLWSDAFSACYLGFQGPPKADDSLYLQLFIHFWFTQITPFILRSPYSIPLFSPTWKAKTKVNRVLNSISHWNITHLQREPKNILNYGSTQVLEHYASLWKALLEDTMQPTGRWTKTENERIGNVWCETTGSEYFTPMNTEPSLKRIKGRN